MQTSCYSRGGDEPHRRPSHAMPRADRALYTGVNARFDKLAKVVGQTLTVASII